MQQNGENYLKKVAHTGRNGKRDVHPICTKLRQYSTVQLLYMYTVYRPQEKIAAFKQQKINEINQNTKANYIKKWRAHQVVENFEANNGQALALVE